MMTSSIFRQVSLQPANTRLESMEKPHSLTTPHLAARTNPLFPSHSVKMNAGLTQAMLEVNHQHGARKKKIQKILFTAHFPLLYAKRSNFDTLVFNPLKKIQLQLFTPYEHHAHPSPAHGSSSTSSNTITTIKYF